MDLLKLENITVRYGLFFKALDSVSFSVKEGEILGLVGPNGCGKSTLLKVICGLITPGGNIFYKGQKVKPHKKDLAKLLGYAPQENSFFHKLTVKENMKYFSRLYGIGNADRIIDSAIRSLGLEKKKDTLAEKLSGGMKRRLNIGCSIIHDPPILLLDEPSVELDPLSRNNLWKLIRRINQSGTTIIISTNTMEEAEALCSRLVLLDHGKKVKEGSVSSIINRVERMVK
jgi:ABC-2 type transport system ATP-binding protein